MTDNPTKPCAGVRPIGPPPPMPPTPTTSWWDKYADFLSEKEAGTPTIGAGVTPIGPPPPCTCDCRERLEKLIVSIEALRDDARIVMEIWKTNTKRTRKVHFRAMGQEHTCQLLLKEAKP